MKLTIVSSYFPAREQPYRGRTAYKVALELRKWMKVEAICPISRYPKWLQPRNFLHWPIDHTFSPGGIQTAYVDYFAIPWVTRITNGFLCARSIEPLVRRAKPDVLQSYFLYPEGYATVRIGRKLGVPVVLVAIGSDLNRIANRITERFTRQALSEATHVMTMGGHLRNKAIELGADPARVSSYKNGCETEIFNVRDRVLCRAQVGLDASGPLLVYVGRLDVLKGLRELLDATAQLLRQYPLLRLAYVGDGPALPILQQRARALGIGRQVIFAGASDSETVARWLGACTVFTLPSYAEGSPIVIIEALNCGRPIVASRVGGIAELFDAEAGILIPPGDAKALANALVEALNRKWDESAIARRYYRPWSALASEMQEVLELVALRKSPSHQG